MYSLLLWDMSPSRRKGGAEPVEDEVFHAVSVALNEALGVVPAANDLDLLRTGGGIVELL